MTHWLWDNAQRYQWWLEIRFRAAKMPGMRYVGDTNVRIKVTYGEWPVTISYLKCRWHADERAIGAFLQALEEDGLITRRKCGIITVIAVCGFEKYCFAMRDSPDVEVRSEALDDAQGDSLGDAACNKAAVVPDETLSAMPEDAPSEMGTPTPPYIDTKKEKENKKILIVDKRAREEKFLEDLKKSQSSLEAMGMSLHCGTDDLASMADDFTNGIIATEDWHPSFSVFKKHFMNWARIQIKNKKHETATKNQPVRSNQSNAKRGKGPIVPGCGLHED